MKYNPRINEVAAGLPGFARVHPLTSSELVQGSLQLIYELGELLKEICGMDGVTLLPSAGAQGEFVGLRLIEAYHSARNDFERKEVLIPDSAHGTNPASAAMASLKTIQIPSSKSGSIDMEALKKALSNRTAALMLTNPSTLGLFMPEILEIAKLVHEAGALLYYDGANLNPLLGVIRPGAMGFDVMHINLHKTFSTPHGGGGPGSAPVLCGKKLTPFLPTPLVVKHADNYSVIDDAPKSIGKITSFFGNFGILLRAYLYIRLHGSFGLRRIAENATLNANYLKKKLEPYFTLPYPQECMHEFVVQADRYLSKGIKALDIAKRLLDYGVHAPTIYFPLIVKECILIEPTETESKETLDAFVKIIEQIVLEIEKDPELLKTAPHTTPVSRLDEVLAAKNSLKVMKKEFESGS